MVFYTICAFFLLTHSPMQNFFFFLIALVISFFGLGGGAVVSYNSLSSLKIEKSLKGVGGL